MEFDGRLPRADAERQAVTPHAKRRRRQPAAQGHAGSRLLPCLNEGPGSESQLADPNWRRLVSLRNGSALARLPSHAAGGGIASASSSPADAAF